MSAKNDGSNTAVVCIGANIGGRRKSVADALAGLCRLCELMASSGLYETEADNGSDSPYINLVALVKTACGLDCLKEYALRLEREAGRTASSSSAAMPLDVDIIMWNGEVVDSRQYHKPYFMAGYDRLNAVLNPE